MIQASGILFLTPEKEALYLLRGKGSDHPLEWAFPGGQREDDESIIECAIRECKEECGHAVEEGELTLHSRSIAMAETVPVPEGEPPPPPSEDVDFTTFLHRCEKQFKPELCDEHLGYCWAPAEYPPQPLHPGAQLALDRLSMDELGIARAMADGRLTSPQTYENMVLYAMRITGTGASFRPSINEHVWRPPEEYLNDDFLARCNGLPVIWVHPETSIMNSKEFAKRVIGAVMLPYIKGDEVWGIVRIYDEDAISAMDDEQMSTSPAVLVGGRRATTPTGEQILFEDKPTLLDHLAVVPRGVWDKGGDPTGIDMSNVEEKVDAMADAADYALPTEDMFWLKQGLTLLSLKLSNFTASQRNHS